MEEFFEGILAIAVIVICAFAKGKKTKNAGEKPTAKAPKPARAVREAAQSAFKAVMDDMPEEARQAMTQFGMDKEALGEDSEPSDAPIPTVEIAEPKAQIPETDASEADFVDAHGCIGGSLGAHEAEGEAKDEHAEHLLRAQERLQAEEKSAETATNARQAARARLKSAVVWSEILDRPASMRSR